MHILMLNTALHCDIHGIYTYNNRDSDSPVTFVAEITVSE
jgi:hypothetical protein